jgi:hypothetical protein
MRAPRVVLSHLPERFQGIRLESLADALARAQHEHLQRAVRIASNTADAAQALGISQEDLTPRIGGQWTGSFLTGKRKFCRFE